LARDGGRFLGALPPVLAVPRPRLLAAGERDDLVLQALADLRGLHRERESSRHLVVRRLEAEALLAVRAVVGALHGELALVRRIEPVERTEGDQLLDRGVIPHRSIPRRAVRSRRMPRSVRDFTVPSGSWSRSAILDCDSPRKYISSI